jgi:outer membrane lipoprotein-sorting protein
MRKGGTAMWLTLVLALSVSALPDTNDAERLFLQMEETLLKAKTIDLSFYFTDPTGKVEERSRGRLLTMSGNKVRLEMFGHLLRVSDGTRMLIGVPDAKPQNTPRDLDYAVRTWLSRSGVLQSHIERAGAPVVAAKDRFRVSGFKLGAKERINGRDTQRVDYQLAIKGEDKPQALAVWIDLATKLPVKRGAADWQSGTENYVLRVNEQVDAKNFDLPR